MAVHDSAAASAAQHAGEQVWAGFAARVFDGVSCGAELAGGVHHLLDFFEEGAGDGGGAIFLEDEISILEGANVDGVAEEGDV